MTATVTAPPLSAAPIKSTTLRSTLSLNTTTPKAQQPLRRATNRGEAMGRADYFCHTVAKASVEILNGARPLTQLIRWVTADVYDELDRRLQIMARRGRQQAKKPGRVKVLRLRLQQASQSAFEACATIEDSERVRAVALRLERRHTGWRVVDLMIG